MDFEKQRFPSEYDVRRPQCGELGMQPNSGTAIG
jgi:hypothetical protein